MNYIDLNIKADKCQVIVTLYDNTFETIEVLKLAIKELQREVIRLEAHNR